MKLKYILGLIIAVVLSVVYYKFNPEVYHFFPECPFHKFLHLDCPGCGSQRAINALLHLNIEKAIDYNLLLVLSIPLLLAQLSAKVYAYFTQQAIVLNFWHKPITPKIIFALVMLFWVARNIPFKPFNYLAA
ncbi:DUF2752 domain-containing protein [Pedobacter soli]|uniref:DUF2752 domain-containing protein n=1 Tax=Pedobacter soli TaxID=390242 RepID=A0A1G6UJ55_9SPHI|nr:DUF2752 domain-containing protein [Pedobacter soli]SDD41392.1 Protein of unknown function [Pedobacter soli]